jgi:hypothetical protein
MNASTQGFWLLGVDGSKAHEAPECRLNVAAGAAEAVIEVEMTEGGVEIVAPHQHHDAAAKPDAFRISRRAVDCLRRLDELICLALTVACGIGGSGLAGRGLGLVLAAEIAALREGAPDPDQQGNAGRGKAPKKRILELEHPLTHEFPEPAAGLRHILTRPWMPFKWVPIAAGTCRLPWPTIRFLSSNRAILSKLG